MCHVTQQNKMATLLYKSIAGYNNALCDNGWKGWLTLPTFPIVIGGLNIVIWICILITATIIYFQTPADAEKSFGDSLAHALFWWYIGLLLIGLFYKVFLCQGTKGVSQAYTNVTNAKAELKDLKL